MISDSRHQFFRDMNLFVDDDKEAYLFASSENNQLMYQVRLNDDYTWIDADDLESSGTTENDIQPGKVITPDMRIGEEKNGGYIGSKYTYDKKSFTRYQLASGGAVKLQKKKDESGADAKDDNGKQIYVSTREDGLLCLQEYQDGRWARVGCNAPEENKVQGKTETTVDNSITTQREAPAPIKIDGKYYLVTSSLSGWKANPSLTQVADSIFGPWTATGNPMTGSGPANNGQWSQAADIQSSFNSQSTCILKLPNGEYMYMGDRWKNGVYETSNSLGTFPDVDVKASTYVWLPITFESDSQFGDNTLKVRWRDSWSFDALGEAAENLKIYGTEPYVYGNLYLPTELGDGVTVTWQTSDAGTITTTGEVTRPVADKQVTLTATVSNGGQSVTKIFNVTVKAKATESTDGAYLFVHFAGESTPRSAEDEQIYFALSDDGMNWEKVHGGKPVLTSTLGTTGVRDPHIVRSPEGDKFYMIATDLSIYNNKDWTAAQTKGSKSIMVWESNDLVNWTDQRMVEIAPEGAGCVWAPESFYDDATGSYMVFWASKVDNKQKIYYSETRDFVNFTEPQIYVEKDNDVIDSTIVKENGTYYRFSKDETTKKVILEKSSELRGTYEKVDAFNVDIECEGPTCFKRADGKWELLVDGLGSNSGYKAYVSDNIASGIFTQDTSFSTPYEFRHGTVIPISAEERDAIKAAYNTSGEITQTASTSAQVRAKNDTWTEMNSSSNKLVEGTDPIEVNGGSYMGAFYSFDAPTLPEGAKVTSATLTMTRADNFHGKNYTVLHTGTPSEFTSSAIFSEVSVAVANSGSNVGKTSDGEGASGEYYGTVTIDVTSAFNAKTANSYFVYLPGEANQKYRLQAGAKLTLEYEIGQGGDDDVIYNNDAQPSEINIPETAQNDPVIYYDFENIKDGVIKDISGNNNNAALHYGGAVSDNPAGSDFGDALYLNNAGTIVLPDDITKNIEDFTVSMKINVKERGSGIHNKKLFDFGGKIYFVPQGNNQYSYNLYTVFGNSTINSSNGNLAMDTSDQDKWSELTITKSGTQIRVYVDGALNSEGTISETTQSLGVLSSNTIGSNMELNIDEFKLYNRALSYKEVTGTDEPELDYTLTVKNEKGVDIQDGMFGLFFEDINYAADGGLYAEMIENRSFEAIKNNGGANTEFDGGYGWTAEDGTLEIKDSGGLNENNPHYAAFTSNGVGGCLKNQAYEGLYLTGGETYKLSFYAKATVPMTVTALIGNAEAEVAVSGSEWKKYETEITVESDQDKAEFKLALGAAGETDFDMISLMPESAACGVFRKDLADKLKALNPGFLRFPGGCVVEGYDLTNAYNWKDSVGDISERKQNWNRWASHTNSGPDGGYKHYNQTLGIL